MGKYKVSIPLFRVWLTKEKRMIYVASSKNDTSLLINEDDWILINHFTGKPEHIASGSNGDILMPGAGSKDTCNKDIYKDDIVIANGFMGIVGRNWLTELKKKVKVVGNKHETPKLYNLIQNRNVTTQTNNSII